MIGFFINIIDFDSPVFSFIAGDCIAFVVEYNLFFPSNIDILSLSDTNNLFYVEFILPGLPNTRLDSASGPFFSKTDSFVFDN